MPSATPERQERWPGMDSEAIKFLEDAGYILTKDWRWIIPEDRNEKPLEREEDAIIYLIEERDFGGWLTKREYTNEMVNRALPRS